jgi:ABC-type branched-subunit amino acid transport system ATPase component/ABC-type branched-subunit amino acid transport system permease subunit
MSMPRTALEEPRAPAPADVSADGSRRERPRPPAMRGQPYLWLVLFLLGVALFRQYGVSGFGDTDLVNTWLFYCVIVAGFYLVFGISGQFAFSQAVFAAVGAYTSAWATRIALFGVDSFWMGVLVAIVITALVAAAFAFLMRRASHFYFAIATLGLSEIVLEVLRKWTEFSGATGDTTAGIRHISVFGYPLDNPYRIFWVWFGALALVLLLTIFLARSPVQREAIATRDHDTVAATLGVGILRSRITMFVLGSAIAGVGGAIFAHSKGFATPDSFGIDLGLGIFVMLILGGIDSRWGPIVGAAFYVFVPQWLQGGVLGIPGVDVTVNAFGQEHRLGDFRDIFFGSLLVIVMIAFPEGLVGIGRRVRSLVLGRAHPKQRTWLSDLFGLTPKRPPAPDKHAELREATMAPTSAVANGAGDRPDGRPARAPVLEAQDIRVQFGGVRAVDRAGLSVLEDEILGLVGPNGSGKTTFLNALTGVVPASGSLRVLGSPVQLGRAGRVRALGVVRTYQSPQTYEHLTCIEDVLLSTADRGFTGITPACIVRPAVVRRDRARWDAAVRALDRVGLIELAEEPTARLSYGQRRLLELARAINAVPRILLLDEPSAGLDSAETEQLAAHLRRLQNEGVSMLLVDHKLDFITSLCDRVAVLELGRLVAVGPATTVFEDQRVVDAYLGVDEEATSRA